MKSMTAWVVIVALLCGCSAFTDPAVRLAYGLERAEKSHTQGNEPVDATCDLRVSSDFVVVLHPGGELSDAEWLSAGLPADLVDDLRSLRLGPAPSIYVLPRDPKVLPSRTTYQRGFVHIPRLMVAIKTKRSALYARIEGPRGSRFIVSIQ